MLLERASVSEREVGGAVDEDGVFGTHFVKKNRISAGVGIGALASLTEAFALARDLGLALEAGTFSWSGTVMGRVVCFVLLDKTLMRSGVAGGVEEGFREPEDDEAVEGGLI